MKRPTSVCIPFLVLALSLLHGIASAQSPLSSGGGSSQKITVCGMKVPCFVLKNRYAYHLIFPVIDRASTQVAMNPGGAIRMGNILHDKRLWSATIDPKAIVSAYVINQPILPGVFHFGASFDFGDSGLLLEADEGGTTVIRELAMGTGPEKAFSLDGTFGFQLLQMRASSLSAFEAGKPLNPKVRNHLEPKRVDIGLFFLAEVEEAARLAALTSIRALKAEYPEKGESPQVQKYHFLGANCVSSGIQNLARAVRPEHRSTVRELGKADLSTIPEWNEELAKRWIESWNEISFLSYDGLRGGTVDEKKLSEVSSFHKGLRDGNQMSLPWRAKKIINWASGR